MATSYTAPLNDGKAITFEQFVLRCSRAFGALISMRDERLDAPIPTKIEPHTDYYKHSLTRSKRALTRVRAMNTEQARRAALAEWKREQKRRVERILNANDVRYRYQQMLEKVRGWQPPTADHEGLKAFMIEQLESSIDFDTRPQKPLDKPMSATAWKKRQIAHLERDIAYSQERLEGELARAAARTGYIQDLLTSLGIEFTDEPVSVK